MTQPPDDAGTQRSVDIAGNRRARKWSRTELLGRMLWDNIGSTLMALSPRFFWGFRRALLRCFGARIGREVHIYPSVRIAIPWNLSIGNHTAVGDRVILYALGAISIGERVTISQHVHLCAGSHEYTDRALPLLKLPIHIQSDAWVCADAFIGPGVTVGSRAIAAARAVVTRDVPEGAIVGGNPARFIKQRPPSI